MLRKSVAACSLFRLARRDEAATTLTIAAATAVRYRSLTTQCPYLDGATLLYTPIGRCDDLALFGGRMHTISAKFN